MAARHFGGKSHLCLSENQASQYMQQFLPECLSVTVKHPVKLVVGDTHQPLVSGGFHSWIGWQTLKNTPQHFPWRKKRFPREISSFRMTIRPAVEQNLYIIGSRYVTSSCRNGLNSPLILTQLKICGTKLCMRSQTGSLNQK